jgi:hypothetical protein
MSMDNALVHHVLFCYLCSSVRFFLIDLNLPSGNEPDPEAQALFLEQMDSSLLLQSVLQLVAVSAIFADLLI